MFFNILFFVFFYIFKLTQMLYISWCNLCASVYQIKNKYQIDKWSELSIPKGSLSNANILTSNISDGIHILSFEVIQDTVKQH